MGKGFAILVSLVFIVVQTMTMAHAAEFGDEPHSHNDSECVLAKFGDRADDDIATPAKACQLIIPQVEALVADFAATALLIPTVTQSPPGRAPPHA